MTVGTASDVSPPVRKPRHRARELAVQMLYQAEVGRLDVAALEDTFWGQVPEQIAGLPAEARAFALRLAVVTAAHVAEVDPLIAEAAANWRLERMNVLDRIVLRLAVYELRHEPDTPPRVVINEALELARTFGTDDSVRFVNGVLDAIPRKST